MMKRRKMRRRKRLLLPTWVLRTSARTRRLRARRYGGLTFKVRAHVDSLRVFWDVLFAAEWVMLSAHVRVHAFVSCAWTMVCIPFYLHAGKEIEEKEKSAMRRVRNSKTEL